MRVRVPRQSSTKWWFLLAAILATAMTWCQNRGADRGGREPRERARRAANPDVVELELVE